MARYYGLYQSFNRLRCFYSGHRNVVDRDCRNLFQFVLDIQPLLFSLWSVSLGTFSLPSLLLNKNAII